jgi:N-acetylglucosamine kinase-like BadF-type ATPase
VNLIVDLGQSGARVKIDDEILSFGIAKNSAESVAATLDRIFQKIPSREFPSTYLSLTGLQGDVRDPKPYGELCNKYFKSENVCVMDDGVASYVGALGDKDGIVLTLGGGVVAIASSNGRFGHADGKGPIFGDFGGGFWLGQSAMRLAVATLDNRESAHSLVALLANELDEYRALENTTGVEASQLCIRAAKTVAQGAESGHVVAREILESGANYLATTIIAAWNKVKIDDDSPFLSIQGGLSQSKFYVELIQKQVSKLMTFEYLSGGGDHLAGAPKAAEKYPQDIGPLLKWWRA